MSVPKNNLFGLVPHKNISQKKSYLECFGNLAKIKAEMIDSCYNSVK
jgi:hypothetical protein